MKRFKFLRQRKDQGELLDIDIHFAEFMAELAGTTDSQLVNLFAELSHAQNNQHACLDISSRLDLQEKLLDLDCVTETFNAERVETPLVLARHVENATYLYLQRYFHYETNIVEQLINRNQLLSDSRDYGEILHRLFQSDESPDWQKIAAFQSVTRQLTIITGGPGTGKTSTVVKILASLKSQSPDLKVKLAAPTGKAASRLSESIKASIKNIPLDLAESIPTEVSTIHRLLGMRADGHSFKHDINNQIATDLLILDEVSMIDIAMFNRLLNALPAHSRLILLGDPGQLPSVENGAVLNELSKLGVNYDTEFTRQIKDTLGIELPESETSAHKLSNAFCHLQKSYRFSDNTGIGALAKRIRSRQIDDLSSLSSYQQKNQQQNQRPDQAPDQVNFVHSYTQASLVSDLVGEYQHYIELCQQTSCAEDLILAFDHCRILSPVRNGDFGVTALNSRIEETIHPQLSHNPYYHGKPIIITKNDYNLKLFNGDIGICVLIDGELKVAFKAIDGTINYFLISRLPPFETCFVMTVHKSQGSEFDRVTLVLPQSFDGLEDLISSELIYTAVTRAKTQITLYASTENLKTALQNSTNRLGGLSQHCLFNAD